MSNLNVVVGLSGGVDSSLSAYLLKKKGYNVSGISMAIYNRDIPNLIPSGNACYGPEEKQDIKEIGELGKKLGIKTYIFDCAEDYKHLILSYFKEEYKAGRTPNPCIKCNELMKFGLLLKKAEEEGIPFDYFATGHYARIEKDEKNRRFLLKRAKDLKKDQSYFLYRLRQEQLSKVIFPLGNYTKEEVRQMAREAGLEMADKADSQDFYSGDYNDLLEFPPKKGMIMHINGKVLGQHQGYWNFTIGQRKGLGISYPTPLFVLDLDARRNIVWVGGEEDTHQDTCFATDLNWIAFDKIPTEPFSCQAKHRSVTQPTQATVYPETDGRIKVVYEKPQKSFTPGQSLVLYQDDVVLGGGLITKKD